MNPLRPLIGRNGPPPVQRPSPPPAPPRARVQPVDPWPDPPPVPLTLPIGRVAGAVFTSPHATPDLDPLPALLALINGAKTSLLFGAFGFTSPDLAAAIIARHAAGVSVRGVCDRGQAAGATSQVPALVAAGVDVRLWGSQWALQHEKVIIADGNAVAAGSYNFTTGAERANKEVMFVLTGTQVAKVLAPVLAAQIQATYAAGSPFVPTPPAPVPPNPTPTPTP